MLSQTAPYTYLEHTADIGIEVQGQSLEQLFQNAAEGLTSLYINQKKIDTQFKKEIHLEAVDIETLLFRWLNEFLFLFDAEKFILSTVFTIGIIPSAHGLSLDATVVGYTFDPIHHEMKTYVKAVTYHHMEIISEVGMYRARFYVDV